MRNSSVRCYLLHLLWLWNFAWCCRFHGAGFDPVYKHVSIVDCGGHVFGGLHVAVDDELDVMGAWF